MRQGYKYPMEERVGTGLKGPEPESYLPKEYIENHANAFEGGASHLEKGYSYHQFYENAPYFQRSADHHIFVTPKNEHWICGGYTEVMMPEGIAYNVKNRSEF